METISMLANVRRNNVNVPVCMFVWLLLLGNEFRGGCAVLEYPIDEGILKSCSSQGWLCRPPTHYSNETLEYISTLAIKDPYFYDAFSEDEIFKLFRPRPNTSIPFYIWEDESLQDIVLNAPSCHEDGYQTFLEDLKQSAWRTRYKSAAILHFVSYPLSPLLLPDLELHTGAKHRFMDTVMSSPEFRRFNGSNFFYVTAHWKPEVRSIQEGTEFFHAIQNHFPISNLKSERRFFLKAIGIHYSSFPVTRSCSVPSHYTPPEQFVAQRVWPGGSLESYKYPLGHYAQMLKQRPHKFFFAGQIDHRPAYDTRRVLLTRDIHTLCESGTFIRTGQGPEALKECVNGQNATCPCQVPFAWRDGAILHRMMSDSVFGFHIRGDDFYSARIGEILVSGTIPVVVDKVMFTHGMCGQCQAPWRHMAVYVDHKEFLKDPAQAVQSAIDHTGHHKLEQMTRLLHYYRDPHLHGRFAQSQVVEARVFEAAVKCVTEEALQQMGFSKRDLACAFEDLMPTASFLNIADEDGETFPWGCGFTENCDKS